MRIKTFEAPTLQDALSLAKLELGDEAVVLNTRHVKTNGLLGLRGGAKVELTAAVDDVSQPTEVGKAQTAVATMEPEAPVAFTHRQPVPDPLPMPQDSRPMAHDLEIADLRSELQRLNIVVQNLVRRSASPIPATPLITRLGIDADLTDGPLSDLLAIGDPEQLISAIAAKLQPFVMPPTLDRPKVIAVVGPTGVGKTTTLAKLAARFCLERRKKVALVTADTFRIGAVEQLRTYARIMGLPLEIALSPEEVAAGVEKHRDKDVVLIDTVGRSQRSEEHLRELKTFLDAAGEIETHLVVAASLSSEIQREVVGKFAMFSPDRLVITKLDESSHRGSLVNLPIATGLGVSCVTAGQNVPQDIEFADAGRIAQMVVATGQVQDEVVLGQVVEVAA